MPLAPLHQKRPKKRKAHRPSAFGPFVCRWLEVVMSVFLCLSAFEFAGVFDCMYISCLFVCVRACLRGCVYVCFHPPGVRLVRRVASSPGVRSVRRFSHGVCVCCAAARLHRVCGRCAAFQRVPPRSPQQRLRFDVLGGSDFVLPLVSYPVRMRTPCHD